MYKISVDLVSAVEDFYPGLSLKEIETIAKDIHDSWDYSSIYDELVEQLEVVADNNGINLDGKDGIEHIEKPKVSALLDPPIRPREYTPENDPFGGH